MSDDEQTRVERDEETRDDDGDEGAAGVVVPWERLSAGALRGVIEEFITREGTEYGADDVALERKLAQVQRQLESAEVVVLFDARAETVNLVRAAELPKP